MIETFLNSYFWVTTICLQIKCFMRFFFVEVQFVFILLIVLRRSSYFRALSFFLWTPVLNFGAKSEAVCKMTTSMISSKNLNCYLFLIFIVLFLKETIWFHQWRWIIVVNTRWYLENKIDKLSFKKRL